MRLILGLLCAFALATPTLAQNADHDPIINYSESDAEMNAAKAEAQRTLPQFFAALAKPRADQLAFLLKFNLTPDGDAEFIWANNIVVDGDKITATLANAPLAEGFAKDDRVTIDRALIIDWGYFQGNTMLGNYTTRVMLKSMSPEQAAEVKTALGW
jgi:uncharacterized protein YegJ (DUF2314 family)